jgi:O-antigen/teichoic acid export membrane protein
VQALKSIAARLKRDDFANSAAILMAGTTISQAIVVLCSPILTRLYSPENFGLLAIFVSACSILGVIATGRYELAILVPKDDRDGYALVVLSCLLSVIFSTLSLVALLFAGVPLEYLWLPGAIFLSTTINSLSQWRNRQGEFRSIATFRLLASITNAAVSIAAGFAFAGQAWGLIVGLLFSYVVSLTFLVQRLPDFRALPLRAVALRYSRFPKYLVGAHLMNVGSQQLPLLLLGPLFGLTVAGLFMLTYRAISLPLQIVASAIGEVFRSRASRELRELGECRATYVSTFIWLLALSIPTFGLFFLLSPTLFSSIFGDEWRASGEIARILTPMFAIQFVASPLSNMFIIAEQQRLDLFWQIGMFTSVSLSFAIGFVANDYMLALILYSAGYTTMQAISLLLTYKFSSGWRVQNASS